MKPQRAMACGPAREGISQRLCDARTKKQLSGSSASVIGDRSAAILFLVQPISLHVVSSPYRDSARETASAASEAGMNSLNGRFGNAVNPKPR